MRALALAMALLSVPAFASAQDSPEAALSAIREMTFQAQFTAAIGAARAFLDRSDLAAADRNAGLESLAIAQIANRDNADARETLALLYSRDPGHRLSDPDASPPVLSAFARARESSPAPVPVRLEHTPPTVATRQPPRIVARVVQGGDAVQEMRLVYRAGNEGEASVVMSRAPDGSYAARIPVAGDPSMPLNIAYHILAMAPSLRALISFGSAAEPLQVRVPAGSSNGPPVVAPSSNPPVASTTSNNLVDERPPTMNAGQQGETTDEGSGGSVLEEWWFWTLIGAVVVGGVVTGVLLGTAASPQEGTLGSATLTLGEF
ncbi:MAG: hypothetical protein AB8I08_18635 [Sandaracinaceae bacterium]